MTRHWRVLGEIDDGAKGVVRVGVRARTPGARVSAACALLASSALSSRLAEAQSPTPDAFTLEWIAPPGCPDQAAVTASIRELLRARPEPQRRTLRARAAVENDGEAWTLRVRTGDGDEDRERVVPGADCAELADAAAVIVALAVDTALHERPPPPAPLPASAAPVPTRPPAPGEADQAAAPAERPGPAVVASAGVFGAFDAVALPAPAPGLGVEIGVGLGRLGIAAHGTWLPSQRATIEGSRAGGDVSLLLGGATLRYRVLRAPLELDAALAFEVGSLHAEAVEAPEVPDVSEGRVLWLAPGAGLRAGYPISPHWVVQLGAMALFPLSRERFVVLGLGEVHRPPVATVRGTIGIEARVW